MYASYVAFEDGWLEGNCRDWSGIRRAVYV